MDDNLAYEETKFENLTPAETDALDPTCRWNHSIVELNLSRIFSNYLHDKSCQPVPDGCPLFLDKKNYLEPDFMIVCDLLKIDKEGVHGAPDLVIEILSPSTAMVDRTKKKDAYERAGVREYWMIEPNDKFIEIYLLENEKFVHRVTLRLPAPWQVRTLPEEKREEILQTFTCSLFPDFEISLADIFDHTF